MDNMIEKIHNLEQRLFLKDAYLKIGFAGFPEDGKDEKVLIQKSLGKFL